MFEARDWGRGICSGGVCEVAPGEVICTWGAGELRSGGRSDVALRLGRKEVSGYVWFLRGINLGGGSVGKPWFFR